MWLKCVCVCGPSACVFTWTKCVYMDQVYVCVHGPSVCVCVHGPSVCVYVHGPSEGVCVCG